MSYADARSSPRFDALWRTVVSDDPNLQSAMRRVAESGCAVMADCDSASIAIIERGRPVTVGSTNDTAQALDDAQYSALEGPCLAAAQEGRTIRIDDTGNDDRWPKFAARASANGVHKAATTSSATASETAPWARLHQVAATGGAGIVTRLILIRSESMRQAVQHPVA